MKNSTGVAVLDFLKGFSASELSRLFESSGSCLAVFRSLNSLARLLVLRLLYVTESLPVDLMRQWFKASCYSDFDSAVELLKSLHILQTFNDDVGQESALVNASFQHCLQRVIEGKNSACSLTKIDDDEKPAAELENYAKERWEAILYCLALPNARETSAVSETSAKILETAGLAQMSNVSRKEKMLEITSEGFHFLLSVTDSQVWTYLINYLRLLSVYSSETFDDPLQDFLQHLREIGLVKQAKRKSMKFYPTPFAINLIGGNATDSSGRSRLSEADRGFLIVETNFRLYAYTDSPLKLAIVSKFCDLMYRFNGFAAGILTRESVQRAFQAGITAAQIIEFLRSNAHEHMLDQKPILPPNVTDQLKLWELERDRFSFADGVLYSQFLTDNDFQLVRNYAKEIGALVWETESKRLMVVSLQGHDDVKQFWKQHKQSE